jgi:P-type conjugative transfer protein TrbJ
MIHKRLRPILGLLVGVMLVGPLNAKPASAQLSVFDPTNLVENALTAARALEQINNQVVQITNQIQQLQNDALNLTRLGVTFAPQIMAQLQAMDQLINEARGLALQVSATRSALISLYSGDYRGTTIAARAQVALQQIDAARGALHTSLLMQAQATEQLRIDQATLDLLASTSGAATGALAAQQTTNELLAFQAQQSMRLQALLLAQSRAEALEGARALEVRAQAQTQHAYFFAGASAAHPGQRPWQ